MTAIQMKKRGNAYTRLQARTAVLFLLPNLLGFLLFIVYPVFRALIISLTNWNGFMQMDYVGFSNYVRLFSDSTFNISLQNTLVYTVVTVPLSIIFGILMAVLMESGTVTTVYTSVLLFRFPSFSAF